MLSAQPLSGVTVLEIGHSLAGPYAGLILAELGAEVIKVERPGKGDYARDWGPPFVDGAATTFHTANRNKRAISMDLQDSETVDRLRALIRDEVDVVLHNLKYGALERLGLAAESLCIDKPGLIVCNVGAFGHTGPLRDRPGYDPLMQAMGGLMSINGEEGGGPVRVPVAIIDITTGLWSAIAILSALLERNRTGQGGTLSTSLYETAVAWMSIPIAAYLESGGLQKRHGSANAQIVPHQAFTCSNGYLMVAAGNDVLFARLVTALGRPELGADDRFNTNAERVVNREALIPILEAQFAAHKMAHWSAVLDDAGVPCGPINSVDQVVEHPQTAALGMIQRSPDNALSLVGLPISFDGIRPPFTRPAPGVGEHNPDVLGD